MKEVKYSYLKKRFPRKASAIKLDQETIALFLNAPVRKNWMEILKLKKVEQNKIKGIADIYAKLKVNMENKLKPKTKKQIVHIENLCLQKIFSIRMIRIIGAKNKLDGLRIAKQLLKKEYKSAVLFDSHKLNNLAVLTGADGIKGQFATDFLIFDAQKKAIIGVVVVFE